MGLVWSWVKIIHPTNDVFSRNKIIIIDFWVPNFDNVFCLPRLQLVLHRHCGLRIWPFSSCGMRKVRSTWIPLSLRTPIRRWMTTSPDNGQSNHLPTLRLLLGLGVEWCVLNIMVDAWGHQPSIWHMYLIYMVDGLKKFWLYGNHGPYTCYNSY